MINLIPYDEDLRDKWDNLVDSSFNGTFMQKRGFIDYNKHNYDECSLLVEKNNKICAVFPAAYVNNLVISHPGLSFAGLIFNDQLRGNDLTTILKGLKKYFNYKCIIYKTVPKEFHRHAIADDIWALQQINSRKIVSELSTILNPLMTNYEYWKERKEDLNNLQDNIALSAMPLYDISFIENFWKTIVNANLKKYNIVPTHSAEDIFYLYSKFPIFIKGLLATHISGKILGGLIIFRYNKCYHVQYSVSNSKGRALNVMSLMHHYMLENLPSDVHYYNFGKSTDNNGQTLNESLYYYKNSFGGGSLTYDTYEY